MSNAILDRAVERTSLSVEDDHKRVTRLMADGIVTGRKVELIDEVCHPDYVWYGPSGAQVNGRDGYRALVGVFHTAFPDLQSKICVMIAEGEYVSIRCRVTGVNDGPFLAGPATHKPVDFNLLINLRFADGMIIEQYEIFDWPTLMQQLGLEPVSVPVFK
jgi:predicted ester cyclase